MPLGLVTNGSYRTYITAGGNVGIGTTSPSEALHVKSTSGTQLVLERDGTTTQIASVVFKDGSGDQNRISSSDSNLIFESGAGNTERARIDSSGRLLVGTSSARNAFFNGTFAPALQIEGTTYPTSMSSIVANGVVEPYLILGRTRAGSIGGTTVVNNGDTCGAVSFQGSDGTELVEAASIAALVDGTPGANDMPGRLVFSTTADGASSPTERMRIDSSGDLIKIGGVIKGERGTAAAPAYSFSDDTDTGIFNISNSDLGFSVGGTERARIDSSGRLLVGTSSNRGNWFNNSSWGGPLIQLESTSSTESAYSITNSANNTNAPLLLLGKNRSGTIGGNTVVQSGDSCGQISFFGNDGTQMVESARIDVAVDSTPGADDMPGRLVFSTTSDGASSPTERLRIDSSGRVGIGTTPNSDSRLHVKSGVNDSNPVLRLEAATNNFLNFRQTGSVYDIHVTAGDPLSFTIGASERARIDSSGRLLVGTSSTSASASAVFQGYGGTPTGPALLHLCAGTATPTAELGYIVFGNSSQNEGATITAWRDGGTWTSGSSHPSRLVFSTTADGASSPTERMRINAGGNFLINQTTTDDPAGTNTQGLAFGSAGWISNCRDGATPVLIGRKGSDGTLVEFFQDGTVEGSISVSGTTVSYNGAHLSRWSQLPSGAERTEILRGTVLSNIDEMCEWGDEENEQLNRMKVSDVEGDKNVSGVFQAWDDDDDTYTNDFYCAMTGDFIIRIGAGVTVERGDLLMSAGDGTAKPQDDDIIRSKTIAKVTSTNVSCTYDDGSYCVPCVLMAC
jgi:hypothetical protein